MSDPAHTGRRRVVRYVSLQLVCAAVAAAGALSLSDWNAARSAMAGGIIIASGTAIFGWMLFAVGIPTALRVTRALYAGELLKWLWVGVAFWLAFMFGDFKTLALLGGALAAQVGFWIGVGVIR